MKELNASTKAGQRVISMASYSIGVSLDEVYGHYSSKKAYAYDECRQEYLTDIHAKNFRICSRNVNRFTVAWNSRLMCEEVLHVRTGMTDYLVWLER